MNENDLKVDDIFYAVKKFGISLTGGVKQYQGVIKSNSRIIIYTYKTLEGNMFQQFFNSPLDDVEAILDKEPVSAVFFDRKWLIDTDKDKLIKMWRDDMESTMNILLEEANKIDDIKKWIYGSSLIKESYERSPEKWI